MNLQRFRELKMDEIKVIISLMKDEVTDDMSREELEALFQKTASEK